MSKDIAQEMAAAARRQAAADARFSKEIAALEKKKSSGAGGRGRGAGGRTRGGGATRGAGTWKAKNLSPSLLLKVHKGSLAADSYSEKEGAFLYSNMLGLTAQERAKEWTLDAARAPRVDPKNLFKHLSFSRPEAQPLSPDQWRQTAKIFLTEIGAEGCQFVLQRHSNTKHDHVHLIFSRVKPDGSLVSDSNCFFRWRQATRSTERALALTPGPPVLTDRPTSSDLQINAARRSARRGTPDGWIDPNLVKAVLARSATPTEFSVRCRAAGIEVKKAEKNGRTTGLLFQKIGSDETLAGSTIGREFSLPQVLKQLEANRAELLKKDRQKQMQFQQRKRVQQNRIEPERPRG